jgi:hypothetical protein
MVFDNFNWFKKFGDLISFYLQEMARVFGVETIRMAEADTFTTKNMAKKSPPHDAARRKLTMRSAVNRLILPRLLTPRIGLSRPNQSAA